jgi:hypothetical protein
LENNCGQQFSYVVNGKTAQYLGQGDLHDRSYGNLEVSTDWNAFLGAKLSPEDTMEGQCIYKVRVFPTSALEDFYMTSTPMNFTYVLVSTFVFTSFIFILYDLYVEKRQKIVYQKALQSTEVVNTLFPEAVRDRLFDDKEGASSSDKKKKDIHGLFGDDDASDHGEEEKHSSEIADVYENATGTCHVYYSSSMLISGFHGSAFDRVSHALFYHCAPLLQFSFATLPGLLNGMTEGSPKKLFISWRNW